MSQLQWMVVVDSEADEKLVEFLAERFGNAVTLARDRFPDEQVKYAVLEFDEREL